MITMSQLFACLSASLSLALFLFPCAHALSVSLSPALFLSLSRSPPTRIVHMHTQPRESGRRKRKVRFFSSDDCICVRWTVHRRCAASSRSSATSVVRSYRWVIARAHTHTHDLAVGLCLFSFFFVFSFACLSAWLSTKPPTESLSSHHLARFFFCGGGVGSGLAVFVLYVRVRRYTLTVDDRREMGGDEASHPHIDRPSRCECEMKLERRIRLDSHSFILIMSWGRRVVFLPCLPMNSRLNSRRRHLIFSVSSRTKPRGSNIAETNVDLRHRQRDEEEGEGEKPQTSTLL